MSGKTPSKPDMNVPTVKSPSPKPSKDVKSPTSKSNKDSTTIKSPTTKSSKDGATVKSPPKSNQDLTSVKSSPRSSIDFNIRGSPSESNEKNTKFHHVTDGEKQMSPSRTSNESDFSPPGSNDSSPHKEDFGPKSLSYDTKSPPGSAKNPMRDNLTLEPIKGMNGALSQPSAKPIKGMDGALSQPAPKRVSFQLRNLPELELFEVHVRLGAHKARVNSSKLRYKAIKEFLKRKGWNDEVAVNMDGGVNKSGEKHDQIIIPAAKLHATARNDICQTDFELKNIYHLPDESLFCTIKRNSSIKLTAGSTPEKLKELKDFEHLLRTYSVGPTFLPTKYGYVRDFIGQPLPRLSHCQDTIFDRTKAVKFHHVLMPSLVWKGDNMVLHIDRSLELFIQPETRIVDFLFTLFGATLGGPTLRHNLPMIEKILQGLQVIRDYTPEKSSTETGPPATIKSIKMPGEVDHFTSGQVKYSVSKFFEQTYNRPIRFPTLPYANIGQVEPGKEIWVPLERLIVQKLHPLHRSGFLTQEAKTLTAGIWLRCTKRIHQFTQSLVDTITQGSSLFTASMISPTSNDIDHFESTSGVANVPVMQDKLERFLLEDMPSKKAVKIGLLYLTSSSEESEIDKISKKKRDENFAKDIQMRLKNQQHLKVDGEVELAVISDVKELTSPGDLNEQPSFKSWNLKKKIPDILVAVVEGPNRGEDDVRAEVHKFGDRRLGSVTVCISKKSLVTSIRADDSAYNPDTLGNNAKEKPNYFPKGFLSKINYMYNGTNYKVDSAIASLSVNEDVIVVGAHIAHPGSESGPHCPSVAAVVANTKQFPSHYYGSARVQPSLTDDFKRNKTIAYSMIDDLEKMMAERLKAYGDKGQPSIIFYRHGLDVEDEFVWEEEIKAIHKAYQTFLKDPGYRAKLTYIVVNHCGGQAPKSISIKVPTSFTIDTGKKAGKYHYYVLENAHEFSQAQLRDFTRKLNNSNQGGGNTATALPIHFAHKLSHRVFDYFRYLITNRYDLFERDFQITGNTGTPSKAATDNSEKMANFVRDQLSDRSRSLGSRWVGVDYPQNESGDPWNEKLNGTMFYL